VPWPTPSFTWRERVGQGPGPAAPGEDGELAGAAGDDAGDEAGLLAEGAEGALPLAVLLEELPHPAASTAAQVSAAAGSARRASSRVVSITVPSDWVGSVSRVTVMTLAPARRLHPSPAATMGM